MVTVENKKVNETLDWLIHVAIAIVVGILIILFVGQRTIVYDISMEPTLSEGDNLLVEKLGFRFGWLHRGDIIVFKSPESDRQLIKRMMAMEGDKVEIEGGKLYINGELSLIGLPDEQSTPSGGYASLIVPEGFVYVLGDNRTKSLDSTEFGPIEKKRITGRAIFRVFPFNRFGSLG